MPATVTVTMPEEEGESARGIGATLTGSIDRELTRELERILGELAEEQKQRLVGELLALWQQKEEFFPLKLRC